MSVLVALYSLSTYAYDVEIDGIFYNLNINDKTAEVTYEAADGVTCYKGDIVIPVSFIFEGVTFCVTSIGELAFCKRKVSGNAGALIPYTDLTSVSIPNSVTSIGKHAFFGCSGLKDVYCYAKEVPNTTSSAFYPSKNTTLHVPVASVDSYKVKSPWYKFEKIVPIGERCATPTISFANGKVKVACATEGTKCVTSIVMAENQTSEDGEIDVSPAFTVSTYATAEGYEDSEVVTATFSWPKAAGDLNEDGHIDISDVTTLVNIILGK